MSYWQRLRRIGLWGLGVLLLSFVWLALGGRSADHASDAALTRPRLQLFDADSERLMKER